MMQAETEKIDFEIAKDRIIVTPGGALAESYLANSLGLNQLPYEDGIVRYEIKRPSNSEWILPLVFLVSGLIIGWLLKCL